MNSFKDIAQQILQEKNKPLHSKEIVKIALERGWLRTAGKTPEATMNAQLIVDINLKKEASRFVKVAPSIFSLNTVQREIKLKKESFDKQRFFVPKNISTKQKGDIAEARIAELITLYGETALSCYKPLSDDEGIDLIVKQKGTLKTVYLQTKSRFGSSPDEVFVATTKSIAIADNYSMAIIFCYFDTDEGDLWNYVWFVPAPDFLKLANKLNAGKLLGFVAGRKKKESNKWDQFLIDKRDLANRIIKQLARI